ncbi:MAG: hypothetical protein JWP74_3402 [Marmoricola sp.]|nr:hypothetical protein [Marmoricola sp.]
MSTTIPGTSKRAVRADIQGLRAIAVSLVLIYHLAPQALTGGFAGVDVFFVISGFLITLHLLEHVPTGPRDLLTFWSRRIRRLLPASLLVLSATLVGSRLVAPDTQWAETARQARAAALYVVNWLLSSNAVDYLAAQNAPSPVQHFWSLSVEEQFYFVWPILILLLAGLARLLGRKPLPIVLVGLTAIVGASLAWSVHLTATNPAAAYFVTPTRVWELGTGGILATFTLLRPGHLRAALATPLAWLGLAAIIWSATTYDASTPFPGWRAAVPVLGTAAVIGAHARAGKIAPGPLLALRPVQWLGGISYSVYLWHWPLVVLVPEATGHPLTWTDRGAILVATLLLATATKALVEDRFRSVGWSVSLPKPFALAAVAMAVVVAGSTVQLVEVQHQIDSGKAQIATVLASKSPCVGARSLDDPSACPPVPYSKIVPPAIDAHSDESPVYQTQADGEDCSAQLPDFSERECSFGPKNSTLHVVLAGNSHAAQWLPALERLAPQEHFRITTMVSLACALSDTGQDLGTAAESAACSTWVSRTTRALIAAHPDLVVFSNRISVPATGHTSLDGSAPEYRAGYAEVLDRLAGAGIPTLVLRDTPYAGFGVPDCVAEKPTDYDRCDGTRAAWLPPAPEKTAVSEVDDPDVRYADLTNHICQGNVCHAVTGGVMTYFDGSHFTATFATTLAPYLGEAMAPLLQRARTS